jgi:hypothetical protein
MFREGLKPSPTTDGTGVIVDCYIVQYMISSNM